MVLEEILSAVLSVTSLFTAGHPPFNQHDTDVENVRFIDACQVDPYEQGSCQELDNTVTPSRNIQQSGDSDNHEPTDSSWSRSLRRSVSTSFTLILVIIPLGVLIAAILYLDLNTTNLCFERMRRDGLPHDIMKWRLIGECCETIAIFLWFPFTLGVLFGWKKFKTEYLFTVYVSLIFGCLVVIFKVILFIYYIFQNTHKYYRFFGNVIFILDVLICSYLAAGKLCRNTALSKLKMSIILSMEFINGLVLGMAYMYGIVPVFNGLKNDITKAIVALTAPICAVIPKAVCMALALRISKIADTGRCFVLVYCIQGVTTFLYRTMQADVKSMWIFIAVSIQHGILHVAEKATKKYIDKIWTFLIHMLRRLFRVRRELHSSSNDTTHHEQRLHIDLDIQNMLWEYAALILIQIYLAFYLITNFEVSSWPILKNALLRIAIAVGIDFFFNCVAIFIQMYWYGIPVGKVWFKHWRLHMLANVFLAAMAIWYFSPVKH